MDAKELKPCPFCGATPALKEMGDIIGIECGSDCDTTGLCVAFPPDKRETAIAAWNRRAALPSDAAQAPLTDDQILRLADACGLYGVRRGALAFAREVLKDAAPVAPAAAALERDDPQIIAAANKAYATGLADGKALANLAAQPDERAAFKEVGFITQDDVLGWNFAPTVGWEQLGKGRALYARATAPQAATKPDTADAVFRRCLDLEIQNLTVNGSDEITWMAISCRGVVSSLQARAGADTEDAERYRWLRCHRLFPSTSTFSNPVELDVAIDAARKVWKQSLGQPPAWVAHDTQAARDVLAERVRQVIAEGWTPMHDDQHADGDLAIAASVYAASAGGVSWPDSDPYLWPWAREWWKPTTPRRDLVKAAALIIAEIERIDRAESGDERADAQDGAQ